MSTYKLYYFNGRGRAEVSRLIFAAAGQKYEDIRCEFDEWPLQKTEMPLGQAPVLELDGTKLPRSISIARFLAKQFNLAGKDDFQQVQVNDVVDTLNDAMKKYVAVFFEKDKTKKEELTKIFFAEEFRKYAQKLETLGTIYGKGGSYFVGNHLTWADLFFHAATDYFLELDADCLNDYPSLKQNRAEVEKQPKVAEYLKNRPKTEF